MENKLVGEKTIAFSIAQEILSTSTNIPPIPGNGVKILEMARQPIGEIDLSVFAKLVESDPSLFTRVLRLSNSSYYSEMEKIITLRAAITRIGLTEMTNSVCLYIFQTILPRFPTIEGFSYDDYWSHSWACAVANRRLGHPNLGMGVLAGELYITGLLHGMGKLLMAIHFPDQFKKCIIKAREHKLSLYEVEKDVFGTTDALVAARIMKFWNLPPNICAGVAFHQMPELAQPENIIIAGLTQFAYGIAAISQIGNSGDGLNKELSSAYFAQNTNLSISKKEVQDKLVQEILSMLAVKSGKSPSENHTKQSVHSQSIKKKKVTWIKSLFGMS
ncbi:MAG: HDOD domain-containing protein [Desulfobacula sp.]|nr:HDOD domain-containing protein [Desulfobacula sp.]